MNLIDRLREVIKELEDHSIGPNVSKSSIFHDCLGALEALEAIECCIDGLPRQNRTATEQACLDRARAAIAKAKGAS